MSSTVPVSEFPKAFQDQASKLDLDRDGAIGADDIAFAIDQMDNADSTNKLLKRVVKFFGIMSIFLVCSTFGSSIAAARLANDVELDPANGFAYVKGSHHQEVMKTNEAIVWKNDNIVDATNAQLANIKELLINDGEIRFVVKGHARDPVNADVIILVEGGTLRYGDEGLIGATGEALSLIETHFNKDLKSADGRDGQRDLFCGCSWGGTSSGSAWSF
jgi:hypothetical protein